MSIEKHRSIILSTMPYRESSLILTLYSEQLGRISAIAKGVRKNDRRSFPIERGYLIEHVLYVKNHRDLHLITDSHLCNHFPAIRGNLEKTAARDLLFDVIIAAIRSSDMNLPLFFEILHFLNDLDGYDMPRAGLLLGTARVLFSLANHLGFSLDMQRCAACGSLFTKEDSVTLVIQDGFLQCDNCNHAASDRTEYIAAPGIWLLAQPALPATRAVSVAESLRLVHCAVSFCCCHMDIRRNLDSYQFIEQLFSDTSARQMPVRDMLTGQFTTSNLPYKEFSCYNHP